MMACAQEAGLEPRRSPGSMMRNGTPLKVAARPLRKPWAPPLTWDGMVGNLRPTQMQSPKCHPGSSGAWGLKLRQAGPRLGHFFAPRVSRITGSAWWHAPTLARACQGGGGGVLLQRHRASCCNPGRHLASAKGGRPLATPCQCAERASFCKCLVDRLFIVFKPHRKLVHAIPSLPSL